MCILVTWVPGFSHCRAPGVRLGLSLFISDEEGAFNLVEMIIQKILSRRENPPQPPPEDDGPQLRVVK